MQGKALLAALAFCIAATIGHAQQVSYGPGLPLSGGTLSGPLTVDGGLLTNVTISGGTSSATIQVNSAAGGALSINSKNSNDITFNNRVSAPDFKTPGNTITLSGSTVPVTPLSIVANWAGSSTLTGNTSLRNAVIGPASDNAAVPNGGRSELLISGNYGGANFTGIRFGMLSQLQLNTVSALGAAGQGLVGYGSIVTPSVNLGGVSSGFGTTQFGLGSAFGENPWARCATGATFLAQCVGAEIDASIQTGASAANFSVLQLVLTSDHAMQGTVVDTMLELGAQVGASAGVRNLITAGRYDSQFPLDANGYLFQVQSSENGVAAAGAGGFDLNQFAASGSGPEGGAFYWRSPGVQILDTGLQAGYLSIAQGSGLTAIDGNYQKMATAAGSITVAAGGSNYATGDLACDAYGDCVKVTAAAGAVTGVSSVVSRGNQASPPADPVSFTARTRSGSAYGSGLTLNLGAWTAGTTIAIGASGNTRIGTGSALATNATSGFLQIATMAGTPTGTVGAAGQAALVIDTANKKICYSIGGGTWECTGALLP